MRSLEVGDKRDSRNPRSITYEEREKQLDAEAVAEAKAAKRAKQSSYSRWLQCNLEHTQALIALQLKNPKAAAILTFLVDQMDNNNTVIVSYQVLQELLGVSKETVRKSIKVLKESSFIAVLKSGTSNVYAVNDSIYWKSWGSSRKYSKFSANVILTSSEQSKEIQNVLTNVKTEKQKIASIKNPYLRADGEYKGQTEMEGIRK